MSNTRTALAHSISYPLTSMLGVPHGIACSITLPEILVELEQVDPVRAELIAAALGVASAAAGAAALYELFGDVGTADVLRARVPTATDLAAVEERLITPARAGNSLVPADPEAAARLLRTAYERVCA